MVYFELVFLTRWQVYTKSPFLAKGCRGQAAVGWGTAIKVQTVTECSMAGMAHWGLRSHSHKPGWPLPVNYLCGPCLHLGSLAGGGNETFPRFLNSSKERKEVGQQLRTLAALADAVGMRATVDGHKVSTSRALWLTTPSAKGTGATRDGSRVFGIWPLSGQ